MLIALGELGVEEWRGDLHNPRILEYHATTTLGDWARNRDETPWCSSFCQWVMAEAGIAGSGSAAARSWIRWGREVAPPELGCVVVMRRRGHKGDVRTGSSSGYHVGLFVNYSRGGLIALSGNTADRVGMDLFRSSRWRFVAFRQYVPQ